MRLASVLLPALCVLAPFAVHADALTVEEPSIIVAPVGQQAAVLLRLENRGEADDRLIGADAGDLAAVARLLTHIEDADGAKRLVPADDGIALPAGTVHMLGRAGDHALGRDGDHALFLDLARVPTPGEEIPLTLIFESGAEITLQVPVQGHPTADRG
ncbi:MAG: copper chaperone PCu(A)C [Alkalilacustris sp.]